MSSTYFRFIATKTTYAATIPLTATSVPELARRVRGALLATGYPLRVGELKDFPLSTSQANMVLCDGSELPKLSFSELFEYLGDSQGTPVDAANFVLPNFVGVSTPAPTYPVQVVTPSDVNTGTPPTIPPTGTPGGVVRPNPPSGGRPNRPDPNAIEPDT